MAICLSVEGEQEKAWLTEAGLAPLFDESASDPEDMMGLLFTLTRTQAAAVEKRFETIRKRNKQHHIPDVRDIFKLPGTLESKVSLPQVLLTRSNLVLELSHA